MRISLLLIVLLVIFCTLFISNNHAENTFDFIFFEAKVHKSFVMGFMLLAGFILGTQIYSPAKPKKSSETPVKKDIPLEISNLNDDDLEYIDHKSKSRLTDEDKEYIS